MKFRSAMVGPSPSAPALLPSDRCEAQRRPFARDPAAAVMWLELVAMTVALWHMRLYGKAIISGSLVSAMIIAISMAHDIMIHDVTKVIISDWFGLTTVNKAGEQ